MKVPSARVNPAARFVRLFLPPFRYDKEISLDFQELLENQREALGGRFFEGQHPDVVVIEAKKSAMAFDVGLRQVVVEKRVMLQSGRLDLDRREVQELFQEPECLVLVEQLDREEVIDLLGEARNFLGKNRLSPLDFGCAQHHLLVS